MTLSLDITSIPAPRVPLIDSKSGLMAKEWYRFFLNLYGLVGGGSSNVSIDDLLKGPPPVDVEDVINRALNDNNLAPEYQDQSGQLLQILDQAQLSSLVNEYYECTKTLINECSAAPTTLTYVVPADFGGTGVMSYTVGDILYASGSNTLSKLSDIATGNALISGGVGTAPSWGKVGLTTHVTGVLPTANGGTNLASFTANGVLYASSSSVLATSSNLVFDGTKLGVQATPAYPIDVGGAVIAVGTKSAASGAGGNVRFRDDTGTERYLAGLLGSAGYTSFAIYDVVNSATRFSISSTGVVALGTALPVTSGGTGASSASITAFNNITGYTASGATGTTSTNLVFSTSPTLTTPKATTTIGVGNATPSASGSGVSFPATQSASSDANTLDDYEEGTWTPGFTGLTVGNGTVSGSYVKIGRQVYVTANLTFGTTTSITGIPTLTGLPFTCSVGAVAYGLLFDIGFSQYPLMTNIESSATSTGAFIANSSGGGWTSTVPFTAGNTDVFRFTGTYLTST